MELKQRYVLFCFVVLFGFWVSGSAWLTADGVNPEGKIYMYAYNKFSLNSFINYIYIYMKALFFFNLPVKALMGIKESLNDPHGVLNWDTNAVDPCSWSMITCSHDSFVISL